jgi:PAS domain-containing protein
MDNAARHPYAAALAAEAARLECLHTLQVLDTPPDPTLDALAAAAAAAMGCPAALVSLVDETRQWFKARIGVDASETPREWSFCHHAVQSGEFMVVPDACDDKRFAGNPYVTGAPGVRFYAGVPLWVDDFAVGTLCVVDWVPRRLTAPQEQTLKQLAAAVQGVLERDRSLKTHGLNEVRLRDFVYASAAFVWECNAQGRLVWASPGAAAYIHPQALPADGRLGWNGPLRDGQGRLAQPPAHLRDLLADAQPFINRWVDLPGLAGPLSMSLSALPVTGASGVLAGWRGKARDIRDEISALHLRQEIDTRLAGIAAHVPGLLIEFALTAAGRSCQRRPDAHLRPGAAGRRRQPATAAGPRAPRRHRSAAQQHRRIGPHTARLARGIPRARPRRRAPLAGGPRHTAPPGRR